MVALAAQFDYGPRPVSTEPSEPSQDVEAGAPPDAPRGRGRWWFLAVPAVALVELLAEWVIEARVPKPEHWRAAHDHIAHARRAGDLVASAPVWTDPLARMYFRDLIAMRDAARPDATRYARAWVATIRGREHPDFRG